MLCFWAAKGGAGTSVTAAAVALSLADAGVRTLLVDLAGDQPAILGLPHPDAGIAEWAAMGPDVPADALDRLRIPVTAGCTLLPLGTGTIDIARAGVLTQILDHQPDRVIIDAGTDPGDVAVALAVRAERSVLVTRACYLAVHRVKRQRLHPTDLVVLRERGRVLADADIQATVGAPLLASFRLDDAVARAVDAGLLASSVPKSLRLALSKVTA